jgi:hypothetical protein
MFEKNLAQIKESFRLFIKNPLYIVLPVLLDLIFLLSVGASGSFILAKSIPLLEKFASLSSQPISIETMASSSDMSSFLSESMEKTALSNQVLVIFFQFIMAFVILWIIFQGLNWFLASKLVKGQVSLKTFFLNFSAVSLFWSIVSVLGSIFIFRILLNNILNPNNLLNNLTTNIISVIFIAVLLYFMLISYAISHKYSSKEFFKQIFKTGIKDFKSIITAYVFLIILFLTANFIMQLTAKISPLALFFYGLAIIMPLIAFSRLYLTKTIER